MNPIKFLAAALISTTFSISSYAQYDFKFGRVSRMEVQMDTYDKDTTAGAVILCDIGKFNGVDFKFTRHIRVKILKKSGLSFGNWVFNTPSKGDFKVQVFNIENGEIIKEKATASSIYNEDVVDNFQVYKVFAPGVRVGSVIDISYSFLGLPFEWRFQETIPVVYNSLTIEPNSYISYTKSYMGFEPIQTMGPYQWRAINMPAFKSEPFINDYSNYITKFNIQISSIGSWDFSSWKKIINNILLNDSRFGQITSNSSFLNDFARELKSKDTPASEKIAEAYTYIQTNIKWSGIKSLFLSKNFRGNFLTDHVGNSADINLFLYALLTKAGISAYPVVLSTRDNGLINEHSPSIFQLNYVVVMVRDGNSEIILDATSLDLMPGMVPSYCLNGRGLLVMKDTEQWIDLNKKNMHHQKQFVSYNINPDGISTAKNTREFVGYGFEEWSKEFRENNGDKEIQKNILQKEFIEAKITGYEVALNDKASIKSKEIIEFDVSEQIVDTGEELIFNPLFFLDYSENPFKSETRKYPIDLTFPKEHNSTVLVNIPAGYRVSKIPQSVKLTSPDGSVTFTYLTNQSGYTLQLKAVLKFTRHIFTETEYLDLRGLHGEISKIVTTPIELVKAR